MLVIHSIRFQRFRHPPYSPVMAPMDTRVFMLAKSHLSCRKFGNMQILVTETVKIASYFDE